MELPTNVRVATQGLQRGDEDVATRKFRDFADRFASGDDVAATELLSRYTSRLVGLARKHLGAKLAAKVDPEDMVQSVLRTFIRRLGEGTIELRDWSGLAGLLALLTVRRCAKEGRAYTAANRDVSREMRLETLDGIGLDVPDREPTPYEVAEFADLFSVLLESLTERDRQVVEALATGETIVEVAARLGRTESTVYRALRRIENGIQNGRLGRLLT